MKVIVREAAEEDIDSIFAYIAKDNPAAAANPQGRSPGSAGVAVEV